MKTETIEIKGRKATITSESRMVCSMTSPEAKLVTLFTANVEISKGCRANISQWTGDKESLISYIENEIDSNIFA